MCPHIRKLGNIFNFRSEWSKYLYSFRGCTVSNQTNSVYKRHYSSNVASALEFDVFSHRSPLKTCLPSTPNTLCTANFVFACRDHFVSHPAKVVHAYRDVLQRHGTFERGDRELLKNIY